LILENPVVTFQTGSVKHTAKQPAGCVQAATSRNSVISDGAPNRFGGPQ
jgi:hypothetical protein